LKPGKRKNPRPGLLFRRLYAKTNARSPALLDDAAVIFFAASAQTGVGGKLEP
jgi:hypothetical protein